MCQESSLQVLSTGDMYQSKRACKPNHNVVKDPKNYHRAVVAEDEALPEVVHEEEATNLIDDVQDATAAAVAKGRRKGGRGKGKGKDKGKGKKKGKGY